jgi:hypothetical protein
LRRIAAGADPFTAASRLADRAQGDRAERSDRSPEAAFLSRRWYTLVTLARGAV